MPLEHLFFAKVIKNAVVLSMDWTFMDGEGEASCLDKVMPAFIIGILQLKKGIENKDNYPRKVKKIYEYKVSVRITFQL